jgi:predicted RNA-binding Zn-ribbon protein involved in translation (DUF1610 family)
MLNEMKGIQDIYVRVEPGEEHPAGECPECGALCHLDNDPYRLPKELLPPFKVRQDGFGYPEVLIGDVAHDGGRWAMRNEECQNEFQKMAQRIINEFKGNYVEQEVTDKFEFLLSHAVHMGWYIHVPKRTMDDLDQLDNDRRAQVKAANQVNTDSQERIGKLACPECGGESITMFRSARVTSTHKVSVVDGRIDATHMIDSNAMLEPTGITFMCEICRHRWDAPDWVLKLVNWDSDDSPIPYSLTNSGRVAAEVVEDEDDED